MSFSPSIFHWIVCLKFLFSWVDSKSYWYAMSIDYLFMLNSVEVPSCLKYLTKDSWFPFSLLCSQTWCSFHFTQTLKIHLTMLDLPCDSPWSIFEHYMTIYRLHSPMTWIFLHSIYSTWPSYPTKTNKQTLHLTTSLKLNPKANKFTSFAQIERALSESKKARS